MEDCIIRYVIRRVKENDYYTGLKTMGSISKIFSDFSKAKIFKNVAGAKVACRDLYLHFDRAELEIVEVETKVTDNKIQYQYEQYL